MAKVLRNKFVVSFINILRAAFAPMFCHLKTIKPNCNQRKAVQNTFSQKKFAHKMSMKLTPLRADPIKLFFFFFAVKLGHFKINEFFLYVTNAKAYQRKT